MAFLVIRENGTAPDKCVPFKWQTLTELCHIAAKHGLGSPAVTNMLRFMTVNELTPYDIKQIVK